MRKYNGVYKLPIHKHTPKRYKRSVWTIQDWVFIGNTTMYATNGEIAYSKVRDIRGGLENPLWSTRLFNCTCSPPILGKYHYPSCFSHTNGIDWYKDIGKLFYKQQKGDWSVTLTEMSGFEAGDKLVMKKHKPSLLTRVKNKLKRRK